MDLGIFAVRVREEPKHCSSVESSLCVVKLHQSKSKRWSSLIMFSIFVSFLRLDMISNDIQVPGLLYSAFIQCGGDIHKKSNEVYTRMVYTKMPLS